VKYPLVHKYQLKPGQEKAARKVFSKPDNPPKIFIVTDKLLTGYDAPILYCMYLDKPMRDHVLLQTIARVNRPYEEGKSIRKPCGMIVDFVGIFERMEKALAFDSDYVSGVIKNVNILMKRFIGLMTGEAKEYLALVRGTIDDKVVERAIDVFADHKMREKFYTLFKELETLYEILSPSPDLRDYLNDFGKLSILYQIIRNAYRKKTFLYGEIARKTEKLVKGRVAADGYTTVLPEVQIDENTLQVLKKRASSDTGKVINLVTGIRKKVAEDGRNNPYLKSIGERAEAIQDNLEERRISSQNALQKMEEIVGEILEAEKEKEQSGFDGDTFAVYWLLKQEEVKEARILAPVVNEVFMRFPNYDHNIAELRQLKAELYKIVLPITGKTGMLSLAGKLLRLKQI